MRSGSDDVDPGADGEHADKRHGEREGDRAERELFDGVGDQLQGRQGRKETRQVRK